MKPAVVDVTRNGVEISCRITEPQKIEEGGPDVVQVALAAHCPPGIKGRDFHAAVAQVLHEAFKEAAIIK